MGSYVERYWVSDATGMNKAERLGGAYRPYVPDKLCGYELLMEPSCAAAVARASEALSSLGRHGSLTDTEPLARIRDAWRERTGFRAGSAGSLLLDMLPGTPALSIKTAQEMTARSYPAARSAVLALVDAGILRQNSKNRKSGIYVAHEVVDAFSAYERSLATVSGDTSASFRVKPDSR